MKPYKMINYNSEGVYELVSDTSNIHYYVNEQKKTVVAVIDNAYNEIDYELNVLSEKYLPQSSWSYGCIYSDAIKHMKNKTYRGKAHCVEGDVFDLKKGMKVARTHLLTRYYIDRTLAFVRYYNILMRLLNEVRKRASLSSYRASSFLQKSDKYHTKNE